MATDVPAVKAKIQQERDVVAATILLIDVPAERALMDAADAMLAAAMAVHTNKSRRWTLVNDKLDRLAELDRQIELLT